MLSCREATEVMSQGLDRPLGWSERVRLRVHLLICKGCRATNAHFGFLRASTAAWRAQQTDVTAPPTDQV